MEEKVRHIVRIAATDLEGAKPIQRALLKVKGISFSFSNALCTTLNIDGSIKTGSLTQEQITSLEHAIKNPADHKIPAWMLNRQKDYSSGVNKHLTTIDLNIQKDSDIKRLRKIKSFKGFRHAAGLPVRGQRTKAHFRHGTSLGVKKSKKGKKG